jgi:hypothetical protein
MSVMNSLSDFKKKKKKKYSETKIFKILSDILISKYL